MLNAAHMGAPFSATFDFEDAGKTVARDRVLARLRGVLIFDGQCSYRRAMGRPVYDAD
jgi:hypothetical protein